jgi:hypothetical protein
VVESTQIKTSTCSSQEYALVVTLRKVAAQRSGGWKPVEGACVHPADSEKTFIPFRRLERGATWVKTTTGRAHRVNTIAFNTVDGGEKFFVSYADPVVTSGGLLTTLAKR